MLDCVEFERQGIPAVALAHDLFEVAAHAQAKIAGFEDIPVVVTPRPRQSSTVAEMLADDSTLVERVAAALEERMRALGSR